MLQFFTFEGRVRQLPYAFGSLAIFCAQYAVVIAIFCALHKPLALGWHFWAIPARSLAETDEFSAVSGLAGICLSIVVSWLLVSLAFRRATDANVSRWIATFIIAPFVQIPAFLLLCALPSRDVQTPRSDAREQRLDWKSAIQGALAAIALTAAAVAMGALLFGTYGYGIFVVSPFVIGAITAYLGNRKQTIDWLQTSGLVAVSLALAGASLIVFALEGVVCIIIAAPLVFGFAMIGALLGRSAALSGRGSARQTLMSVALLPVVFASEQIFPSITTFDTVQQIDISAPADAVWHSLIYMRINSKPPFPFRLGIAYPVKGDVVGSGVGAVRYGVFSTGVAIERVTEWEPNRKLAFVMLRDPPAMHELSPYAHVNAPHVRGYFRTPTTSFELVPLDHGRTRVIERTSHELKLDPVIYWMPLVRWVIDQNNARVLDNLRRQSESLNLATMTR